MKRLVLQFVLAIGLTAPVFLVLTSFDTVGRVDNGETRWKLLIPPFRLYGAVGIEGEDEVIAGVPLIASFTSAVCFIRFLSIILNHRHAKRHPP
ncbi:hypothetical protein [Trinickia soli]|uniref:Uncharacterized protein n=1 Tax=Trinickia soli TaxID=380675 RepID=A0A2N7W8H7_9BURK|nr:hypothetical protein [Trinickia soli]KAA0082319.1 hypothetical protein CIW54_20820 [Paraburkholderia sp. T12-10]PMS25713.1 hypothetical protein C0Z19_09120 [Trinickia soli]CAB3640881.1 hypothetical protein LMG24076_00265 [Trinickia soli]